MRIASLQSVGPTPPQPVKSSTTDAVTVTSTRSHTSIPGRDDESATLRFGVHWSHMAWWLIAWNVAVPIRLVGMFAGPFPSGSPVREAIVGLILDQTGWALATYVMFRLALRARYQPLRQVLTILAVLAVPLLVLKQWMHTTALALAFGHEPQSMMRALWFAGPLHLLMLVAAAALGLLIVYMQRERDSAVRQSTLQAELVSARLQTLRLQLNPHFLFNALNSIASLVHSDVAKADTAIAALSSFLRASLAVTRGEETSLEDELRLVDAYLEIESFRFDWLTVDLDIPDELRSACVPAFVLQLLVENAIRHGLAPRRASGRVEIAACRNGDLLELSVSDDGVGFGAPSDDSSLGIGLENVRARLAQLHGAHGTLTISPAMPQGTVATIRIPYRVTPTGAAASSTVE